MPAFNISPDFLRIVAQLESGGDPSAASKLSSAQGLYQFTKPTARAYGLANPLDPIASTQAFKSLTADNYATMKDLLGREPTESELYLAHQQGAHGAAKLLNNPDTPAAQLVGKKAVKNNGGTAGMTGADFANLWKNKYEAEAAKGGTQMAAADPIGSPTVIDFQDGAQMQGEPGMPQSAIDAAIMENAMNARMNGHTPDLSKTAVNGKPWLTPGSPGVSYGPAVGGGGMDYSFPTGNNLFVPGAAQQQPQGLIKLADSGQIQNDAGPQAPPDDPNDLFAVHGVMGDPIGPPMPVKAAAAPAAVAGADPLDLLAGAPPAPAAADPFQDAEYGKGRTFVDQFNQGTTMGWGHELTSRMGAAALANATIPKNASIQDFLDAYDAAIPGARNSSLKNLEAQRAKHPWLSGASQIGGAVTGAVGLSKLIPSGVAARAAQIAKAAPNLTAAAVGGGGAAINALGEAPGTGAQRFDNLGWNVPIGMAGGVAGYQLAKAGGKIANAIGDRFPQIGNAARAAGQYLGILDDPAAAAAAPAAPASPFPQPVGTAPIGPGPAGAPPPGAAPNLSPTAVAGILDEEDAAKMAQGRVLPMTAGERTQNVKTQRMEEIARKAGSQPFAKAAALQQDAAYKPLTSILGDSQQLDPIALNGRVQDEMTTAANALRGQYDALGNKVNAAYKAAGDGAQGVSISADTIKSDFMGKVGDTLALENVQPGDIPRLDKNLEELGGILNPAEGDATTTAVKLDKLEAWKKRLNRTIGNTAEPADKRIVQMVGKHYDEFLGNLADDAIVNGDSTAIDAFKNARSLASQRFKFYDADSSVQKILDNRELSGTQLVNTILGANKMAGKGDDGRIVETMLDLAGDKAPDMANAMRRGVMAKVLNDSLSATTDATTVGTAAERKMLDFGKMKKSLGALMQQRETFGTLFSSDEQAYFKQMYKDIDQIASKQPGAVNNSSTGAYVADMVQGLGKIINNPLFKNTLGAGAVTTQIQNGLETQAKSIVTGKAEAGLGEFLANAFKQVDAPAVYYGGYMGSQSVDPIANAAGAAAFGEDDSGDKH